MRSKIRSLTAAWLMGWALSGAWSTASAGEPPSFADRWRELSARGQPATGANGAELSGPLAARLRELTDKSVRANFPDTDPLNTDFQALRREAATPDEQRIARQALQDLAGSDLAARLRELASAPRWTIEPDPALLLNTVAPQLGHARQIARYQSGRMALALEAGDWDLWLEAFEQTLQLGRQVERQPMIIAGLVGVAIQALAFQEVQWLIASGRAAEPTLARIDAMIRAHALPGPEQSLAGERLLALDTADFVASTGKAGAQYLQSMGMGSGPPPARPKQRDGAAQADLGPGMPALDRHVRIINDFYDAIDRAATLTTLQRRSDEALRREQEKAIESSLVLGLVGSGLERALRSWDQYGADLAGIRTLVAIERHRLAEGAEPASLAALVPAFLAEPPTDPYTGRPLGYLPPKDTPYEGGRRFVLYAAGNDAADDGGNVNFASPFSVNQGTGDLLLNRVTPAPVR